MVTDGIYRWSRKPQAVGWILVLAGVGLVRESWIVLVLAVGFWVAFRLYLPVDEALVHQSFADA